MQDYAYLARVHNWRALPNLLTTFASPAALFAAILKRRPPASVRLRTPTGTITLALRNLESLKTTFSVFCRRDYDTSSARSVQILDIGANVGVAACYFLSRNPGNRIRCYEPDQANLPFLRRNLKQFGDRAELVEVAVGPAAGSAVLFRSEDGQCSSLIDQGQTAGEQLTEIRAFSAILVEASAQNLPIVIKIDIEGLEVALVESVDFTRYPAVTRLVVESLECAQHITRPHSRTVRAGYVEDIVFT